MPKSIPSARSDKETTEQESATLTPTKAESMIAILYRSPPAREKRILNLRPAAN